MNATRALTKRLKSRKEKTAWSAGRVQTPTLAMLVERELEILAHEPRAYWRVSASFEHAGALYTGEWFDPDFVAGADEEARDDRIFDEARAQAIVARVAGQARQRRARRASPRRNRRRRSSTSPASSARATAASAGRRGARSRPRSGSTSGTSC